MSQKIYTKKGDQGETSLIGGERISKTNARLHAYGSVDEVNSVLGVVRAQLSTLRSLPNLESYCDQMDEWLQMVQNHLFRLGSHMACRQEKLIQKLPYLNQNSVESLEEIMDECSSQLPELKEFILPGGSVISSHLQLARAICRRAERYAVEAFELTRQDGESFPETSLKYLNRLSDLLFVLARYANYRQGISDLTWKK